MQEQAFTQVARAYAGGFELLDAAQYDLDLIHLDVQFRVEGGEDVFQRLFQIAVVIDAIDDAEGDQAVGIGHRRKIQLPREMALQAFAGGGAGGEVPLVVVIAGQAAGAGLVDVFPGGIHRQLVGDAFAPLFVVQAVDRRRGGFLEAGFLGSGAGRLAAFGEGIAAVEVLAIFLAFEHRVGLQRFLNLLLQVQRGELEQSDGLLQLRGHRQLLTHLEDERWFHGRN
ncbi:hypothetical protein D9M71_452790 [compost metagenome]